jgi:hypothetical protein
VASEARSSYPLTVVVSTTEPWPKLRSFLERVAPELHALRGELVVCDGHGSGLPPDGWPYDVLHVAVVRPGASVFDLRAHAAAIARGEIVAFSEDHCVPELGWCVAVIEAHRSSPDADFVGGAVRNGSTQTLVDWANFLSTFAEFLPPLPSEPGARVPPAANLSFKRLALPDREPKPGWIELQLVPRLHAEGRVVLSEKPRVVHVQSHGGLGTFSVHFHNGRATMGLPGHRVTARLVLAEILRHLWLPWQLWWQTRLAVRARSWLPRRARLSLPLVLGLAMCHSAGELVGLLAGPGRSPTRLE